ncbi:MAG: hypothetical protein LIO79_07060 [Rikenellaceae bacterium]|nr:hypothetical protein [Rikenellaceae bacterium]
MNGYLKTGLTVIILFISAACIKDSNDSDDCWKKLKIEPRWIDTSPQSSESTVRITATSVEDQDDVYNFTSGIDGINVEMAAGTYEFIGWEPSDNVTIDKRTVTVGTHTSGTALEAGAFSGGTTEAVVNSDDTYQVIPLPMYRQTRELYVRIIFSGNGLSLINEVVGTITGIALSRDIDNGFPPRDGETRPEVLRNGTVSFTFLPENTDGWYIDGHNLIGIDGDSVQDLDVRVMYSDASFSDISVDVTDAFDDFHTVNVLEPMYIVIQLNIGINFEMDVTDWSSGSESWLTAQ